MKFLIKLAIPFVKKYLVEELSKESNKTFVVKELNKFLDLPNLSEEQEQEIIEKMYDSVGLLIKSYLQVKED